MKVSCSRAEFLSAGPQVLQHLGSKTHLNKLIDVFWIAKNYGQMSLIRVGAILFRTEDLEGQSCC